MHNFLHTKIFSVELCLVIKNFPIITSWYQASQVQNIASTNGQLTHGYSTTPAGYGHHTLTITILTQCTLSDCLVQPLVINNPINTGCLAFDLLQTVSRRLYIPMISLINKSIVFRRYQLVSTQNSLSCLGQHYHDTSTIRVLCTLCTTCYSITHFVW